MRDDLMRHRARAIADSVGKRIFMVLDEETLDRLRWAITEGHHPSFPIPYVVGPIAELEGPGGTWRLVDEWLVDTTGRGSPAGYALTWLQMAERMEVGKAYGVTAVGAEEALLGTFQLAEVCLTR